MDLMHSMQSRFSFKAFGLGLVGVAVVYAGLFGIAFIRSETTFESLQARLASQTVLVDRSAQAEAVETVDHLDTHDLVEAPAAVDEHSHASSRQEETLEDVLGSPSKALGDAPIDGFYEDSEYGRLPIAKSEFETPFSVYRKPFCSIRGGRLSLLRLNNSGFPKRCLRNCYPPCPAPYPSFYRLTAKTLRIGRRRRAMTGMRSGCSFLSKISIFRWKIPAQRGF